MNSSADNSFSFFSRLRLFRRKMASSRHLRLVAGVACVLLVFFLVRPFDSPEILPTASRPHGSPPLAEPVLLQPSPSSRRKVTFKPSSFDWTKVEQHFPVELKHKLPTGAPKPQKPVQHDFSHYVHDPVTRNRQKAVRAVFERSWNSYKEHAWLRDELAPVSGVGKTTFGGWGATLVDALDTLWIMELWEDFYLAANAAAQLDWQNTTETAANMFETTIRHLGGLLSAYDLSGEQALLDKATELGNMLYMGFDTPNRMPGFWLNFEDAKRGVQVAGTNDPSASPCSLSLEFTRLTQLTGDQRYFDAITRITEFLERTQNESKIPGMWPKLINFREERVDGESGFTLGALADSLYEYLPKMHALLGGLSPQYEKMHRAAMDVVTKYMLFRPMLPAEEASKHDILFVGDAFAKPDRIDRVAEGQHLTCFTGGMFGLGGKLFDINEHVEIGERLARGCGWAYDAFPTGVMPEIFNMVPCGGSWDAPCPWNEERWKAEGSKNLKKGFASARDTRYILRPEAIESIFLLYRMTGKEDLRDLAWQMFESIVNATETELAYSAISDVTVKGPTTKTDSMESFWLAETLKYFYLIFSPPSIISLDEYVFNTEAHPFLRPKP
ncbi:glycosyl hydrolase family 47 protein [Neurospora crassa OR74A]|uniref:alpha-1,2-Mannosidase n=1 Tax=Neurospora crassa (strain ATCC 24698 / 74-OR23-1A / CBS 708.71 / DSM 1257 / FGSC 987) TaxID=367110 RepID=Q7S5K7_NEUCR|nr:glycosyl hydrolase family 47 protein [Neurospora crassa OR74A]EAA30860.2 glycosyl hydrolase family 47 protein [Neurospora crassa OR74A]|eukprot:XP_960096.2 glycosyl hydrolase family 47 protein [Neurospora crassa OR74A]